MKDKPENPAIRIMRENSPKEIRDIAIKIKKEFKGVFDALGEKPEKEGKSSVTMTSNEDRIRINAIPNDALPSESLSKENIDWENRVGVPKCPDCRKRSNVRLYTKEWMMIGDEEVCPWVCDDCDVVWYRTEDIENAKQKPIVMENKDCLAVLKDIIEHGNWKYLLEVYEKLESGKDVGDKMGEIITVKLNELNGTEDAELIIECPKCKQKLMLDLDDVPSDYLPDDFSPTSNLTEWSSSEIFGEKK